MAVIVMQYPLRPPTENADLVLEQMLLAHRYRNDLTEIERGRRAALRAAMRDEEVERLDVAAKEADAEVQRLVEQMKALRKARRSRAEQEPDRAALRAARSRKWELDRKAAEARAKARESPDIERQCEDINERAGALRVGARSLCGVYWGTYQLIEAAARASRGMPLYKDGLPNDPTFEHWRGEGHIGIRIQNAVLLAEHLIGGSRGPALEGDAAGSKDDEAPLTMIRFGPIDDRLHTETRRRRAVLTTLYFRVGSDERRKAIWAAFPVKLHRPIPQGARIIGAEISRRLEGPAVSDRHGPRARWVVNITVDLPPRKSKVDKTGQVIEKAAAVAVNVGWRHVHDGLRILTWRGSDGAAGTLVLSQDTMKRMRSVQELQAVRRRAFNQALTMLCAWIDRKAVPLPDWFVERTETLVHWKSCERLTSLTFAWMHRRFAGDDEGYEALASWRYNDHHLAQYEFGRRRRMQNVRRDMVRVQAKALADRYKVLIHDDTDLRDLQELPEMGTVAELDPSANNKESRANRVRSCASETRVWLSHAFGREGGSTERMPAYNKTRECHACKHVGGKVETLVATCASCGMTWDQDDNHVRVLLQHWSERPRDGETTGDARAVEKSSDPAVKRETSLQRGKRIKKEKMAARAAAREASASAT